MRSQINERRVHVCPCGVVSLDRTALNSTNIVAVGFEPDEDNPETGTLEVEFRRGIVYQYAAIPKAIYQGLLFASSAGRYFNQFVVEAYDGQRIS